MSDGLLGQRIRGIGDTARLTKLEPYVNGTFWDTTPYIDKCAPNASSLDARNLNALTRSAASRLRMALTKSVRGTLRSDSIRLKPINPTSIALINNSFFGRSAFAT